MNQIKAERIKIARQRKGVSQKELADRLKVTQQTVSNYENGSRVPDGETISNISKILNVMVPYLTGETDDPEGWDLWEEYTGYSEEQIKNEINRMQDAKHILGDENDLQNLITQAIDNLEGMGNTDRGIINRIYRGVIDLQDELTKKYEDPMKLSKLPSLGDSDMKIRPINANLIYDDLDIEAYHRAVDVLIQARRDLSKIANDLRLN